jgi:tetratricopeptide (TPR) repeat protein
VDPVNESAMQYAGFVAANLGLDEEARDYYRQYLTLNPSNAGVRMQVAYDLATAGDPLGAMQFIEVGLEVDPENVELLRQHGNYAFAAGAELAQGQEELPPEAVDLYRKALASYEKVYAAEGEEMDVSQLRRMVVAHIQLGQAQDAVDMAERILETHGQEATIWSIYADALKANGQLDEAIAALDEVKRIDPEYANLAARQGNWLVQEGRIEDAMPILQEAVDRGEQSADAIANVLFANAVTEGIQKENWSHAIETLRLAKEFDISDMTRQEYDFYLGYAIFNSASDQQEPQTLETARATLPRFQEVVRLMQSCADYAQRNNREGNRQQILTATNTFIEIQDAIIRRGR